MANTKYTQRAAHAYDNMICLHLWFTIMRHAHHAITGNEVKKSD